MILNSQKEKRERLIKRITEIDERISFLENNSSNNSFLSGFIVGKINEEIDALRREEENILRDIVAINVNISPEEFKEGIKRGDVLLTEEDKIIIPRQSDFTSLRDLCMVHKTDYLPQNNTLKSLAAASVETDYLYKYPENEKEYKFKITQTRSSIHFSLNGEVGGHAYGNWDVRKYGIITPFPEYDYERRKLLAANPEDTYFYYQYQLGQNSYILVPKEELEEAKRLNPQVNIIPYEGDNVTGYLDAVVSFLGYKQEIVGEHSWKDAKDQKLVSDLFRKYNFDQAPHTMTKYYKSDIYNKIEQEFFEYIRILKQDSNIKLNDKISEDIYRYISFLLGNLYDIYGSSEIWNNEQLKVQYLQASGELLQTLLKYGFNIYGTIDDIKDMLKESYYKFEENHKLIAKRLTKLIMQQLSEDRLTSLKENNTDVIGGRK